MRVISIVTLLVGFTMAFQAPAPISSSPETEDTFSVMAPSVYAYENEYIPLPDIEEEEVEQESPAMSKHIDALLVLGGYFLL